MKPKDRSPEWEPTIAAERVDMCRALLHIHGFLSDAEDRRVNARIEKWAAAEGVYRERRIKIIR